MKRLSKGIMVFVIGVLLLAAGLLFSFDANRFRPQIEDALADTLGRPVSLGQLRVSPWTASLDADDIRIDAEADGALELRRGRHARKRNRLEAARFGRRHQRIEIEPA